MKAQNFFEIKLPKMTTGTVIRAFRKKLGLSQAELAKIVGSKESNISAIENDKREIGVDQALKFAAAFGLDPSMILFPGGVAKALSTQPLQRIRLATEKAAQAKPQYTHTAMIAKKA